jgi:hypothetical protein
METTVDEVGPKDIDAEGKPEGLSPHNESTYLLCRTPSQDCRIDEKTCLEGHPVETFDSKKEALEALRDNWEQGTCF